MKLPIITALALLSVLPLPAATVININDPADDIAKAYYGGGAFATEPNPLGIGNINHLPTLQNGIIKFDISEFAGQTVTEAVFNFDVDYLINEAGIALPFEIQVAMLNYDKTAAAFVVGDLTTADVTQMGSFFVSTEGLLSWDATASVQSALIQGFDYVSLRFYNVTVESGPFGSPAYVGLNTAGNSLNLTVTAVPEPSVWALMVAGSLGCGIIHLVRRRK